MHFIPVGIFRHIEFARSTVLMNIILSSLIKILYNFKVLLKAVVTNVSAISIIILINVQFRKYCPRLVPSHYTCNMVFSKQGFTQIIRHVSNLYFIYDAKTMNIFMSKYHEQV